MSDGREDRATPEQRRYLGRDSSAVPRIPSLSVAEASRYISRLERRRRAATLRADNESAGARR